MQQEDSWASLKEGTWWGGGTWLASAFKQSPWRGGPVAWSQYLCSRIKVVGEELGHPFLLSMPAPEF